MGDASSQQVYKFEVAVTGSSREAAKEWLKTQMNNINKKSTNLCDNCAKEKNCHRKKDGHKNEAYAKPQVDKKVCRDEHCKTHYNKPIIPPSQVKKVELPPPLWPQPPSMLFFDQSAGPMYPPPFWHQQNPVYHSMPPSSLLSGQELSSYGFPNLGGYIGQW